MNSDPKPEKPVRDPALLAQLHLELMGEPCEICERREGTALHHVQYRSQSGGDVRENLIWVCMICHDEEHGG